MENTKEQYNQFLEGKERSYKRVYFISVSSVFALILFSCLLWWGVIKPSFGNPFVGLWLIVMIGLTLVFSIVSRILLDHTRKQMNMVKDTVDGSILEKQFVRQKRSGFVILVVFIIVYIFLLFKF